MLFSVAVSSSTQKYLHAVVSKASLNIQYLALKYLLQESHFEASDYF